MNPRTRTTGYNLFCKELSCEEGVKLLDTKQRFAAYATRWAGLTPEGRSEFKKRAAQKSMLTMKQKKVKWTKCVKKMKKICDEMQSYQPTSSYFVIKPQDGPPRYGGTPYGKNFIKKEYETVVSGFCKGLDTQATTTMTVAVTVNDIRQLFNCKYAEAVGQPGKRMPYKSLVVEMEGLPEGIALRKPQCYGTAQLRKIWKARANLRCVLNFQQ